MLHSKVLKFYTQQQVMQLTQLCTAVITSWAWSGCSTMLTISDNTDLARLWLCCRYVLNYTVTDSLGLSAAPLQITVIIYEAAAVQAQLQMISQTSNRALAHATTSQLTDKSGSTANLAFRTAIATALTSWWANEATSDASESAAIANFGNVDAFPYSIVQPTDVSVLNATFVANISDGTPGFFTFVSRAWVSIQANTSSFATSVNATAASRRRLLQSDASSVDVSALETKLDLLASSFYGASPCNNTAVSQAYYGGRTPVLNGDRPFYCINYAAGESDNIDTYLTSNTASWASLPLFHILQISDGPTKVRYTRPVDANAILANSIQAEAQQIAASQLALQRQAECVNASLRNRVVLHELAALVEASLAIEHQQTETAVVLELYEILLAANVTVPLTYPQLRVALQLDKLPVSHVHTQTLDFVIYYDASRIRCTLFLSKLQHIDCCSSAPLHWLPLRVCHTWPRLTVLVPDLQVTWQCHPGAGPAVQFA